MTPQETALLLAYIQAADPRFQADQASLAVWINCLPDHLDYNTAIQHATHHYQTSDRTILPANIITPYLASRRPPEPEPEPCPDHNCINGWIIITQTHPNYGQHEAAKPCPTCHP